MEQILKARAETAKIKPFDKDRRILDIFDDEIKKTIDDATKKKVEELLKDVKDENGRKNEQKTDLRWALDSIMSRVERGMTVEVRFLPPPAEEVEEGDEPKPLPPIFDELKKISSQLVFPKMDGKPILALPPLEPKGVKEKPQKEKKRNNIA